MMFVENFVCRHKKIKGSKSISGFVTIFPPKGPPAFTIRRDVRFWYSVWSSGT